MKIVLVNHYAGGPSFGMEFRPYYLAREWSKLGHDIIVIGASFSHLRSQQPTGKYNEIQVVDSVRYFWIKTNVYKGNGVGRILSFLLFVYGLFFKTSKEIRQFKPDVIIASSTYPLDVFPIKRLAKKCNSKFCFEVHDLWPLSPMELGGYSKNHPFIKLIQWAEDFGYKNADCVISMLPAALPYMKSRGLNPTKFHFIPNGIDIEEWKASEPIPEGHAKRLADIKKKYNYLIGYTGSHGIANSLYSFLKAGKHITTNTAIVLVGDGPEKDNLIKSVNIENIENVFFLPSVPKKCIPELLRSFDFLFIGLQNQPLFQYGISPNKLIDYMMAGKPILQAIKAGNNMVVEYKCGINVEPEDAISIAKGIDKLTLLPSEEKVEMGENGKKAALKHHSYKVLSVNFLNAITSKSTNNVNLDHVESSTL
ncbi:MAG: glycosyltransferase family 4 protein [Bacteroidetes bacterium]|nr:glycosyltransferase family 4 protein [Bacteroidota bacterium]